MFRGWIVSFFLSFLFFFSSMVLSGVIHVFFLPCFLPSLWFRIVLFVPSMYTDDVGLLVVGRGSDPNRHPSPSSTSEGEGRDHRDRRSAIEIIKERSR